MRFNTLINNQKCKEWGLSLNQGVLFDLINQLPSWATELIIDGKVYYHISRNKVIEQVPLAYSKPDTVYRHFKALSDKELIDYTKIGKKDLVRLTALGKTWNEIRTSEMNPSKFGNESENNSDLNPTYNTTKEHNKINDNKKLIKSLNFDEINNFEDLFFFWNENKQGGKYKNSSSYNVALNKLKRLTGNNFIKAKEVIENSISNNYKGFANGNELFLKQKTTGSIRSKQF